MDEAAVFLPRKDEDVLLIDEALKELARLNEMQARREATRVVKLRFLGGFTIAEVAEVMGVSTRAMDRKWRLGRAWFRSYLESGD